MHTSGSLATPGTTNPMLARAIGSGGLGMRKTASVPNIHHLSRTDLPTASLMTSSFHAPPTTLQATPSPSQTGSAVALGAADSRSTGRLTPDRPSHLRLPGQPLSPSSSNRLPAATHRSSFCGRMTTLPEEENSGGGQTHARVLRQPTESDVDEGIGGTPVDAGHAGEAESEDGGFADPLLNPVAFYGGRRKKRHAGATPETPTACVPPQIPRNRSEEPRAVDDVFGEFEGGGKPAEEAGSSVGERYSFPNEPSVLLP
ncbi:unnamed protein product [Cyprideis torosa]|uniref:Uncharacterized protein n=1 Tax=Cyprideis torosa TaxID=163714 RepID=A0A7R8ZPH1_9CRUS|nr:unnamed protein product [Cyprideis torosa]CAG0900540.1 unnamed protein product [Cyprideis torosa]